MAAFEYTARRQAGGLVTGVIEAASQREVLQKLADDRLFAVRVAESKAAHVDKTEKLVVSEVSASGTYTITVISPTVGKFELTAETKDSDSPEKLRERIGRVEKELAELKARLAAAERREKK